MLDNLDLYHQWEAAREKELEKRPVCSDCGEHIQEDHFYEVNGEPICPDCMDSGYRRATEDYISS